jgi:hypothetical protein
VNWLACTNRLLRLKEVAAQETESFSSSHFLLWMVDGGFCARTTTTTNNNTTRRKGGTIMPAKRSQFKFLLVLLLFCTILRISAQESSEKDDTKKKGIPQWVQQIFRRRNKNQENHQLPPIQQETTNDTLSAWIDEVGEKTALFLKDKIFGRTVAAAHERSETNFRTLFERLTVGKDATPKTTDVEPNKKIKTKRFTTTKNGKQEFFVKEFLQRTTLFEQSTSFSAGNISEILKILKEATAVAIEQMTKTFEQVIEHVNPTTITLAMIYYLADQEAKHTPSWKRQQHRFYERVTPPLVVELHDALYLSQLSYVNSVNEFRSGLAQFQHGAWHLAYGTTESLPSRPAHFLLIHKNPASWHDEYILSLLPWETRKDSELQIVLVIRGTKHLADIIADATLEMADYRGGKAHGGILASGKALVDFYTPKLKELLVHSERDKIKLFIVGHSLGAGAAAIAAMEFNEIDFINVEAVGFGCPALLSQELSESTKDYVTTVVADADIIPRMSGASIVNAILDLTDFDWTEAARDDLNFTLGRAEEATPVANIKDIVPPKETVLKWSEDFLNYTRPAKRERLPVTLIPPGNCIHFFRDGVGFSATLTPCKFFSSGVEFSRTMVEDHLLIPGYHRALVTMMRDWNEDFNVSSRCRHLRKNDF